jgi:hypothetical protein
MPEMIRTWTVPSSANLQELKFKIREPPLTGDNLGLKTWGTAFAIIKKLEEFGDQYFDHILNLKDTKLTTAKALSQRPGTRVLELGSGTGLVGIAAGAIWGIDIILTDLPEIKENLLFNIERNKETVESLGGGVSGDVLDWKNPKGLQGSQPTKFEVIFRSSGAPISANQLSRSSLLPTPSMTMNTRGWSPKTSKDTSNLTATLGPSSPFRYETPTRN